MTSERYIMRPEHEFPHKPDTSVNFNESVYTNAFDMKTPVGGWMRLGNRVNEGYAELSVCLYLADGRIACQFLRPRIMANDRFEAGGLSYKVHEPLRSVSMEYDGDLLIVDNPDDLRDPRKLFAKGPRAKGRVSWQHFAESPVHGGEPVDDSVQTMYGRDFSLGHFNQHSRVKGEIRVGSESFPIDGHGWRDHSWGPRYWQAIYFYRLFLANFPNGDGLMLLKITDKAGKVRREGVLLVDGKYEDVLDLEVQTDWTDKQDQKFVRLGVMMANRKVRIDAEVISLAPLRNRREADGEVLVSRVAEGYARYRWGDQVGYGITEYIERVEDGRYVGFPI